MPYNRGTILAEYQEKNKKRRRRVFLLITILMCLGLVFIFNQQAENIWIKYYYKPNQSINLGRDAILKNQTHLKTNGKAKANKNQSAINQHIKIGDVVNSKRYYQEVEGNIVGAIYLPTGGDVSIPILNGGTDQEIQKKNMTVGASTPVDGLILGKSPNYSLGAHNMWTPGVMFTSITNMKKGDDFYLTDAKYVYTYKVSDGFEVSPSDVYIFNNIKGRNIVTLFTCNHDGDKREIVRGDFVKKVKYKKADPSITDKFNFSNTKKVDI